MTSLPVVLLVTCLAVVRSSDVDVGRYDNGMLIQDLYKQLANIDPAYLVPRDQDYAAVQPGDEDTDGQQWSDVELKSKPRSPVAGGQTDIRDSEYIGHSSNAGSQGFIYMSGGAGEGKQHLTPSGAVSNVHQVKSDESLPFYCHPPNPCPKGYSGEDGCQESIEDTAEVQKAWIEKMMEKGLCNCDEEHMFDCPASGQQGSSSSSSSSSSERSQVLDDVLDRILGDKHEDVNNPYVGGQKRQSLVAKKSPRIKRDLTGDHVEKELDKLQTTADKKMAAVRHHVPVNPYLAGEQLRTVAKKGHASKLDNRF